MTSSSSRRISRRAVLGGAVAAAAGIALDGVPLVGRGASAAQPPIGERGPGWLPDPGRRPGSADHHLPFDHIVVLMMENHSFDNYFGMLPRRGQPLADGFTFDDHGRPLNANPLNGGVQRAFRLPTTCQAGSVSQSWNATHRQMNSGRMDGFAATSPTAMGYFDRPDLPFYYSLASTFTLANRWFSSTPCQTYPNRRFLYAATASGTISTDTASLFYPPPPNGTLMDRLSALGVSWKNYFCDLPATAIISSNLENHPLNYAPIAGFFADAAAGTLPAVSFVDPEYNLVDEVGSTLRGYLADVPNLPSVVATSLRRLESLGGSEENPSDVRIGEAFVAAVVRAVLHGRAWRRTLLVWTYDEHGGYYDHVPPRAAIKPDNIAPVLGAGDVRGAYDIYGPRVPAVVVSPYSRPHAVTNVVHDHTSVIATIAAKWNVPALTYRDANATTLLDFLNLRARPAFARPPRLAAPAMPTFGLHGCGAPAPEPIVTSGSA